MHISCIISSSPLPNRHHMIINPACFPERLYTQSLQDTPEIINLSGRKLHFTCLLYPLQYIRSKQPFSFFFLLCRPIIHLKQLFNYWRLFKFPVSFRHYSLFFLIKPVALITAQQCHCLRIQLLIVNRTDHVNHSSHLHTDKTTTAGSIKSL